MFDLTRQERRVILFLCGVALAGMGVDFLVKAYAPLGQTAAFESLMGRIDLNTAEPDELIAVPGIGQKTALRIIEYRGLNGGFRQVEELKKIRGINSSRYEKLKDWFFVR